MDYQKVIDDLITTMIRENASDLHLSAIRQPAIRIAGGLIFLVNQPILSKEDMMGILAVLLDKKRMESFMTNQEIDFAYDFKGEARLRGNAFFHKGQVAIALRLIPKVKSIAELKLPSFLEIFARKKQGFFLVVGPVGQGKSTTLAAMLNLINEERAEHIITIEDPIEFLFQERQSIIEQRELGRDTKSFHEALKRALRQDPNVIMVGEIRDLETMSATLTAAETGHLVLSTLHTNTAAETIERIVDMFPAHQHRQIQLQLASVLRAVVCQQLLPSQPGGTVVAREILINTPAIANLIREGKVAHMTSAMQTSGEVGMVTMGMTLKRLYDQGLISKQTYENRQSDGETLSTYY